MDRMLLFGKAALWPDRQLLRIAGQPFRLGSRALELLKILVQSRGELLDRRQLTTAIWPGEVVDENNLTVQIANLRKVLGADAIATVAGRGYRFCLPVAESKGRPPDDTAVDAPSRHALPHALTRFIGFAAERANLAQLVQETRLLTLTGMGGTGKTRLAIEVARDAAHAFDDGVRFIDLASLVNAGDLALTVATAVGLPEQTAIDVDEALLRRLKDQQLLLVFDNCEHIASACAALIERLLNAAPGLHVLATSRESLRLPGEAIVAARTMHVPARVSGPVAPEQLRKLLGVEAIELFVSQVRQSVAGFELDAANAAVVVEICRQLDGIPLALELAAARARTMTVAQIAARLNLRFRLLTRLGKPTARHQTLLAVLQWSYEQLNVDEQRLLQALSVFAGGCTLEAAAAVAGLRDEVETDDMLHMLVDKSLLIVVTEGSPPRYRLLETVRHFAREQAQMAGVEARFLEQHLLHFLRLAQTQNEALVGHAVPQALAKLHAEYANLEAAQMLCERAGNGAALGIELANAMRRFWLGSGQYARGQQFFTVALARAPVTPNAPASAAQALAMFGLALLCFLSGDLPQSSPLAKQAAAVARALGDRRLLVVTLDLYRAVQLRQGDVIGARANADEALLLAQALDDAYLLGIALMGLGEQQREEGDFKAALRTLEQAYALMQQHGNVANLSLPARYRATLHTAMGELVLARAALAQAYHYIELAGGHHRAEQNLSVAARLAAACGDWPLAARVQGALDRYCEEIGAQTAATAACLAPWADTPRQQLGELAYAQRYDEGRDLSLAAVTAELRDWLAGPWKAPVARQAARGGSGRLLSPRELELLDLVRRGFSYTDAAGIMRLSLSTVRTHARNTYTKLEVHNKTEAVFEARQLGLLA